MNTLINFYKNISKSRYMIKNMVIRDIKSRYAGSFLGILWSVLNPIALIFTYYFVFSVVLKVRVGAGYGKVNFTVWLISGLLPWIFFSEVVGRSTSTIVANSSLITKTKFPSEILAIVTVLSSLINHIITIFLLLIIGVAMSIIKLKITIILIIPYLILNCFFALGLSWILSSVNVYLRDLEQLIPIVLNLWFYFTPILYDVASVPKQFVKILKINPMYYVTQGYRGAILGISNVLPYTEILYVVIFSIFFFFIGGFIFKKLKSGFGDIL